MLRRWWSRGDRPRSPWLLLSGIIALSVIAIHALTVPAVAQTPAPESAAIPAKLVMGTSPDYEPYEFIEASKGSEEIVGFDIDLANEIADRLGFELEVQGMDFNGLIPALQAGRIDFVMAGMTPTEERQRNVDFTQIYYDAKNTIVSLAGSGLVHLVDLQGKRVGAQLGSIQEQAAREIEGADVTTREKVGDLIQEIKAERIDAAIIEDTIAKGYVRSHPELVFVTVEEGAAGGSAIALAKGSPLTEPFDQVLSEMVNDGTRDRLVRKWFENRGEAVGLTWEQIQQSGLYILRGIPTTLGFTLCSALLGFIWGIGLALCKLTTGPLYWFATAYTSVFRGTPLILQIALVYFATPQLTGYNISAFVAGIITFTLNSGAYISETIRAGIAAVDRGQTEAALSLGVAYRPMMVDIILPQALRNVLPALVNESIALLKDSALVSTIGAADLLYRARVVGAENYVYFQPLLFAGAVYYALVMVLTLAAGALERRLAASA